MAEIIGATASVITLASLFKGCIDAFDLFKCAKNQDIDLKKLNLKLSIERCRLLVWGQSMGFSTDYGATLKVVNDCVFQKVIEESLQLIVQLLTDSQVLARKYGCRVIECSEQEVCLLDWESETPSEIRPLIDEARDLISGLQDITKDVVSKRKQERIMTTQIVTIKDLETLTMISQVCDSDHPSFSDAASCRFDALSVAPSLNRDVLAWNNQTHSDEDNGRLIEQMEEWTITDYRQNFLDLLSETGTSVQGPAPVTSCDQCGLDFGTKKVWHNHMKPANSHCSFCRTTFACQSLKKQHVCFSRKNHEAEICESDERYPRPLQIPSHIGLETLKTQPAHVALGSNEHYEVVEIGERWTEHLKDSFDGHLIVKHLNGPAGEADLHGETLEKGVSVLQQEIATEMPKSQQEGLSNNCIPERGNSGPEFPSEANLTWLSDLNRSTEAVLKDRKDEGGSSSSIELATRLDQSHTDPVRSNTSDRDDRARDQTSTARPPSPPCVQASFRQRDLWTKADDVTLLAAKDRGLGRTEIHRTLFPNKSAKACRKRCEHIYQKLGGPEVDSARAYKKMGFAFTSTQTSHPEPETAHHVEAPKQSATPGELVPPQQMATNINLDLSDRLSSLNTSDSASYKCLHCSKLFIIERHWDWHISCERRRCSDCKRRFERYGHYSEHLPNCNPADDLEYHTELEQLSTSRRAYDETQAQMDLKLKNSSLSETRICMHQIEDSARHRRITLLFTVCTIFFLPMSFTASWVGMNQRDPWSAIRN